MFNFPQNSHSAVYVDFIVLLLSQRREICWITLLAPQILVGSEAEWEGNEEDGEDEAVDNAHPQPDSDPEFEPNGHLGTKRIEVLNRKCGTWFFGSPASLIRDPPFDGWME